ncbi:hypothetical protein [Umezawaea sp. Da 62-37]|uniref:hypothetical protein n=1 Tax=Umezawaea sp. Da 62-37 TaxID=3075927 RepID=UPI0028F74202|nr:hypothetical protein [Umezawaea sp. Da 62-37]WNV83245.1 hypothetical protein RM788_34375 [Umezawaea sp. Da 62-37]
MNRHDEHTQSRLGDAFAALSKATTKDSLRSAHPTLLATCSAYFAEIVRNLHAVVGNTTTAARRMNADTDDVTVAEAYDGTRAACVTAGRIARHLHTMLIDLHTLAWAARDSAARKRAATSGMDIRDLLETAQWGLAGGARHVTTDPLTLAWTVEALMTVADRVASLLSATAAAAQRLADEATTPAETTAYREVHNKAASAAQAAVRLHRTLSTAATRAGDARARAVRKCPECGEPALSKTPQDLTPSQRRGKHRPAWSHRDGTQLCPVVGRDGYEPAQPA